MALALNTTDLDQARAELDAAIAAADVAAHEFNTATRARAEFDKGTNSTNRNDAARVLEEDSIRQAAVAAAKAWTEATAAVEDARAKVENMLREGHDSRLPDLLARRHAVGIKADAVIADLASLLAEIAKLNAEIAESHRSAGLGFPRAQKQERAVVSVLVGGLRLGELRRLEWRPYQVPGGFAGLYDPANVAVLAPLAPAPEGVAV